MSRHNEIRYAKIPKTLQPLDWKPLPKNAFWCDGDTLLVAVAIHDSTTMKEGEREYEIAVVTIECDETYFNVLLDGEVWGWSLEDVDCYVPIHARGGFY